MRTRTPITLLAPLLALGCAGGEPPPSSAAAPSSPAIAEAPSPPPIALVAPAAAAPAPAPLAPVPPTPEPSPSGPSSPPPAAARAGDQALAVLGAPLFLAFKAVACAGSAVIAVPIAAVAGLGTGRHSAEALHGLGAGLARNCGPPYVLTPPEPDQAAR